MKSDKVSLENARAWYKTYFQGCGGETLPVKDGKGDTGELSVKRIRGHAGIGAVRDYCLNHSLTTDAFFTAAFGLTLCAYTVSEQAVFTAACGGSAEKGSGGSSDGPIIPVGGFPVCLNPEGQRETEEYLLSCQKFLLEAQQSGIADVPELGETYDLRRRILFICPGAASVPLHETLLSVSVSFSEGEITYAGTYDPAAYSAYTVNGILCLLDQIAGELIRKKTLKDITLVSQENERTIASFYDTAYPVADRPAYRLLQDSAEKYPDRTALIAGDRTLTYRELNAEANALGHVLKEAGAKPDVIVAVMAERDSYAYVMRQGVLKSGGAFLPLDPEYPEDRVRFILEDSGAKLLVTTGAVLQKRTAFFDDLAGSGIRLIDAEGVISHQVSTDLSVPVPPEALAYVIYTSGSTGKPKGVMLTNKNLVNFVDDNEKNHEILGYTRRGSISLAIAALTFDFSIMEEFVPLANGMTVVLATRDEIMDPAALASLMNRNQVDLMSCTPSYIMNLLDMGQLAPELRDALGRLKSIDLGAEAFPPALYDKLRAMNAGIHIMNGYGPTEATVSCTMQVIESAADITIGIPNANVSVCTIDRNQKLQPLGALGEMVILGDGVGRGYIGREDLTKKSFIRMLGKSAYRSGDLVRIREDGKIEFHGRIDHQVKLRGLRIELGEIESVIAAYPSVRSSVVVVFRQRTDYLAGYFTADEKVDIPSLKAFLGSRLTEYMVPQVLMQLPEMPLTANGKIDRKALPVPQSMAHESYEAPSTEMEKLICEKMALSLGLEKVSVNDDFFEIGGSSITSIRLIMECNHPGINMASIYQHRTSRALAAWCEGAADQGTIDAENKAAMAQALPIPSNMQKYLQMQLADPDSVYCNDAMLFRLQDGIDPEAFCAALNRVLRHHPVFCIKIIRTEDTEDCRQIFDESVFRPVQIEEMPSEAFENLRKSLVRPFHMLDEPLWESRIIRTENAVFFFMMMHHIISDGYSFQVLFDQIHACYHHPDAALEPDYYCYLMKQMTEGASSAEWREAEAYSDRLFEKLGTVRESELSLRPDHEESRFSGAVRMKPLPFPKEKLGGHVPLLTACALAVCAYNHADRALIRFVSEARNDIHRLHSVGLYGNYYPLVLVKKESATPKDLMEDMAGQIRFMDSHPNYPYFEGRFKDPDRLLRFIYQKDIDDIGAFGALVAEEIALDTNNETATDSMCGISVFDSASMKDPLFLERYSQAHYDSASMDKLYELYCEALSYLTE